MPIVAGIAPSPRTNRSQASAVRRLCGAGRPKEIIADSSATTGRLRFKASRTSFEMKKSFLLLSAVSPRTIVRKHLHLAIAFTIFLMFFAFYGIFLLRLEFMQIIFHGAARSTTGSMHSVMVNGKRILLDCGLYQGRRAEAYARNLNFPFKPSSLHTVLLSHAHIDHSGNIPNLVKNGFAGEVYCTYATAELCRAMLRDSAHVQEKDVEYLNKRLERKGEPLREPLYTIDEAEASLELFRGVAYRRDLDVEGGIHCTFIDAGHILGSAITILDITESGETKCLVFTGDLGRRNLPILRDPEIPVNANYLIIESTYGDRVHAPIEEAETELRDIVLRVYERKGKIIIPAFSVGRTQEIVYCLHRLRLRKEIPALPVFVDSPLSVNVTEIFRHHPECFDRDVRDLLLRSEDPFGFDGLRYIRDVERSKELNHCEEPCIIISASGMCEAGRILHHLKNNIEDPKNLILVVGFMAQDTLGRKIVERLPEVRIFGEPHRLRAEVAIMNEFSAHADRNELLEFVHEVARRGPLERIFVVHGEENQCLPFAERLQSQVTAPVSVPKQGEIAEL
jgi:metallo-beta-lactamase family protein